ncbi:endomembrane protein 70 [Teladorsagia circumcincta]|uniref:Transmembrane 9 superfamily member n=1 Tax=Teladorsagia circumcincta TaxID=45464 RepID=A0A2G9U9R6_TELCI|nr:endomembrane protein 70 [Teladorsagia circumcincta]
MRWVVISLLVLSTTCSAFYLPGLAPVNFCEASKRKPTCPSNVTLYVNHLDSDQSVIPYEYHSFDFCIGSEEESPVENLGQVLFGERIRPSPYKISFLETQACSKVCSKSYSNEPSSIEKLRLLQRGMRLNYQHHWIIDNMPITFCFNNQQDVKVCTTGFPMGCYVDANGQPRDACVIDVGMILMRTLHRDIARYNQLDNEEDAQEEFGWKLVHGDVFRPPRNAMMLSAIEAPVRTNQIPRQVPEQTVYTKPLPGMLMGGILPFGCIFIQLFFILNSIWAHQTYYMFGFLFVVFLILIITCSEATILLAYFHLCAEDYHWWWRSFFTSGFTAVYLFAYCVRFFTSKLAITGVVSTILYFSYTAIFVFMFFLMTGTIGFLATYYFMHKIYASVKVD